MITEMLNSGQESAPDLLHPGCRALFRLWEARRGEQSCARRADIDLKSLHPNVPWLYVIERTNRQFRWRLAGSKICELYRGNCTGKPVFDAWAPFERDTAQKLFDWVVLRHQPCILRLRFITSLGHAIGAEMLALPVLARDGKTVQVFGEIQPFRDISAMGYDSIRDVELTSARVIWTEPIPAATRRTNAENPLETSFSPFQVISGGRCD